MKYRVLGVGHMAGTSKKTNRPYDMDVLHLVSEEPSRAKEFSGNEVDKIYVSRDSGAMLRQPNVGDVVEIYYNRSGYVDSVNVVG